VDGRHDRARILRPDPVVTIDRIDEYGQPSFNYCLPGEDGRPQWHTLALIEDVTWRRQT
jgi:hypothetical protein